MLDPNTGITRYREALVDSPRFAGEFPADPRYAGWEAKTTSNLGLIIAGTGKTEEAIKTQRDAIKVAEQVADEFLRLDALVMCRNNLAETLEKAKYPAEAESVFRQTLKDYRTLSSRFPEDVDYAWGVAMSLTNLADVLFQQGRGGDARGLIEEAARIYDSVKGELAANVNFQKDYAKHQRIREAIRKAVEAKKS